MAEKTLITKEQRIVLDLLAKEKGLAKQVYLTGGTALAEFYLHHRKSYDVDLFSDVPVGLPEITRFIKTVAKILKTQPAAYEKVHDRHGFLLQTKNGALKVEFVHYQFPALQKRWRTQGILVDSLKDIAVNKLFATLDRNEPKDLVDLFFILQEKFSMKGLLKSVEKKFGLKIQKVMLAELYYRGTKMDYNQTDLLRGDVTEIKNFYTRLLYKQSDSLFYKFKK